MSMPTTGNLAIKSSHPAPEAPGPGALATARCGVPAGTPQLLCVAEQPLVRWHADLKEKRLAASDQPKNEDLSPSSQRRFTEIFTLTSSARPEMPRNPRSETWSSRSE